MSITTTSKLSRRRCELCRAFIEGVAMVNPNGKLVCEACSGRPALVRVAPKE